ncbi:MAG: FAD-dependent oxidoreductase [Opitutae bacterium]|nr:FAD-dependent oxidoreductase [Opitutae bacterium]
MANLTGRKTILSRIRRDKKRLMHLQPETGFRESYRIIGDTVITVQDYTSGRHFEDAVSYAFYPVDLHTRILNKRRIVSLFNALLFGVMAVSGILAFIQPFSITTIGLHALTGFLFIGVVAGHIINNSVPLKKYFKNRVALVVGLVVAGSTALFIYQPAPIKKILGLSGNLGPALDLFEMDDKGMTYRYSPDPGYKMLIDLRTGPAFDLKDPPRLAVWLENQSLYHIKTLYVSDSPDNREQLPYWAFKVKGWEKAQEEAKAENLSLEDSVDAISEATANGSFDPADYILPREQNSSMPYRVLIEVNQPNDPSSKLEDQPSLVYEVEVDNYDPYTFQLLELVGYPIKEEDSKKEEWYLSYADESIESAFEIVDSALLQIDRELDKSFFNQKPSP